MSLTRLRKRLQQRPRPGLRLACSPTIFICCLIPPLIFVTTNLIYSTLGLIYQQRYSFSIGASGLAYLGMALGSVIEALVSAHTSDRLLLALSQKLGGDAKPEYRIPSVAVGSITIAARLCWYGWSAQSSVAWIVPLLGSAVVGFGLTTVHVSSPCLRRQFTNR